MYEAQHPKEWEFIVRDCEAKVLIVASESILGEGARVRVARSRRFARSSSSTEARTARAAIPATKVPSYASLLGSGRAVPSTRSRSRRRGGPHLHERDDRQPQGGHPHPREHRVERERRLRDLPGGARGPIALVSPVGPRLRADGRAARPHVGRGGDGPLRGRRPHPREPGGGRAHAPFQRPAHLQQDLHGGAAAARGPAQAAPVARARGLPDHCQGAGR